MNVLGTKQAFGVLAGVQLDCRYLLLMQAVLLEMVHAAGTHYLRTFPTVVGMHACMIVMPVLHFSVDRAKANLLYLNLLLAGDVQ